MTPTEKKQTEAWIVNVALTLAGLLIGIVGAIAGSLTTLLIGGAILTMVALMACLDGAAQKANGIKALCKSEPGYARELAKMAGGTLAVLALAVGGIFGVHALNGNPSAKGVMDILTAAFVGLMVLFGIYRVTLGRTKRGV